MATCLRWLLIAGMVGIVAVTAELLLHQGARMTFGLGPARIHLESTVTSAADARYAAWLEVLPQAALLFGLFHLVQLMRRLEGGEYFSWRVPAHLQAFSASIVLVELLRISLPLQLAWLAHRHGALELTLMGEQLWSLLLASLFLVLSSVMREAARLAEDHASIV